jgi:sialate O-acetylesterase
LNKEPVESDEALRWFEICGRDGIWKAATANIVAKNKIEVYSPEVNHPVNVRYAWSSYCDGVNLYNSAGLPAAVFTTVE